MFFRFFFSRISILSELVQNADDAGAQTVRVMLNTREYEAGSLFSPAMSKWQGPGLYVYNDAVFTDNDFHNLAKIGQVCDPRISAPTVESLVNGFCCWR